MANATELDSKRLSEEDSYFYKFPVILSIFHFQFLDNQNTFERQITIHYTHFHSFIIITIMCYDINLIFDSLLFFLGESSKKYLLICSALPRSFVTFHFVYFVLCFYFRVRRESKVQSENLQRLPTYFIIINIWMLAYSQQQFVRFLFNSQ